MPDRRTKKPSYDEKQATRWLSWLARGMRQHGQTVFLIEQLQPSWLTSRLQLAAYTLASRIVIGMSLGVTVVLILVLAKDVINVANLGLPSLEHVAGRAASAGNALIAIFLSISVLLGSGAAILDFRRLHGNRIWALADKLGERWRNLAFAVIYHSGLTLLGYAFWALAGLLWSGWRASEDFAGLFILFVVFLVPFFALLGSLIWGSRAANLGRGSDIATVETLGWSWASARKGILRGFVKGLIILPLLLLSPVLFPGMLVLLLMGAMGAGAGLIVNMVARVGVGKAVRAGVKAGLLGGWTAILGLGLAGIWWLFAGDDSLSLALLGVVALGLFGLCGGVIGGIFGGLQSTVVAIKTLPNQGIRLSLKNALAGGCLVAVPFGLLALIGGIRVGLMVALVAGYFGGARYGGVDCVYHCVLRVILAARGALPFRLPRFLDYAADELHFLQKVGGGYMFIHRYLQEHFAALAETVAGDTEKAAEPVAALAVAD
ncbi:MAG TPA: hypothetical protein VGG03_05490 [Thermoanaerobaculia bacterium]